MTTLLIFAALLAVTVAGLILVIAATAGDGRAASAVHRLRKVTPAHSFKRFDGTEGSWTP
jgi:hypothetical protein